MKLSPLFEKYFLKVLQKLVFFLLPDITDHDLVTTMKEKGELIEKLFSTNSTLKQLQTCFTDGRAVLLNRVKYFLNAGKQHEFNYPNTSCAGVRY